MSFLFSRCAAHRVLLSFPTRRSSDLRFHHVGRRRAGEIECPADSSQGLASLRRDVSADRKSTRLNSSHSQISYAVFCLKKKNKSNISTKRNNRISGVDRCLHPNAMKK